MRKELVKNEICIGDGQYVVECVMEMNNYSLQVS
jgi:hypothetical protein